LGADPRHVAWALQEQLDGDKRRVGDILVAAGIVTEQLRNEAVRLREAAKAEQAKYEAERRSEKARPAAGGGPMETPTPTPLPKPPPAPEPKARVNNTTQAPEKQAGFSAVANQFRELAEQSGSAAADVRKQVGVLRANAQEAVAAISDVVTVIEELKAISASIGAAAATTTARDVSWRVGHAARAMGEVTQHLSAVRATTEQRLSELFEYVCTQKTAPEEGSGRTGRGSNSR